MKEKIKKINLDKLFKETLTFTNFKLFVILLLAVGFLLCLIIANSLDEALTFKLYYAKGN